jgi:two-component system cell cycle sensor histidine kinase/response regulator CckA
MLLGYDVIATLSRDQAVSRFREASGTIQLILMDMIMPGTSAEKAIRQIREIDPTVPVLLASGYSQDGKAGRELMRLCQGFIQKPFRLTELSRTIRDILRVVCVE